ncbi:DUF1016 N-terminal domain-containing protein [Candidatus Venteria ishoeyi]|uniref:YhcG N-terminal domain-containing protein n=1 Tax=Candidatus Venteria ishoeyi TaxID=1899563 RepID=A0A1H6F2E3_9GAMM|nr:DUF1016 N-terminal domain-containing protein [Candidatus Venteria ishoeyi]SEH04290.1 Uncharacterised protein [Candidatus Venteria ishoeyi]
MSNLSPFYDDVKTILEQARSAVNSAMVEAYWLIGKRIMEEEQLGEQKVQYGKGLIEEFSTALTAEFGKGFSYANLYNCRQFYLKFPQQEILYTLCRELSWSHLRLIMRVDTDEAVEYYCRENQQLFASKYQRILPSEAVLAAELEREKRLLTQIHDENQENKK